MEKPNATLNETDLVSPAFFADPYAVYRRLRNEDPVYWSKSWRAWVVTRYADVMTIINDPARFSNAGRQKRMLEQLPAQHREELRPLETHYSMGGLINTDPPDHTRLRSLVNRAFQPSTVERMRTRVQYLVDGFIDAVQDDGGMDVIRDLAFPLPTTVIAEMLGVPSDDKDQFKTWSVDLLTFVGAGRVRLEPALRAQRAMLEMREYLRGQTAARMTHPREDLLTALAAAEDKGDAFTEDELLATCQTLLTAGHETTTNLIGNGLLALLRHPEQLQQLARDPSLIATAIEELLRYDSPVQGVKRVAREDVEMAGKQIGKGQLVYAMLGAANRDPEAFTEPDRLDITRPHGKNRHVAFGWGIHFCVGAPLARLEGPIALTTILRRLPNLRLTDEPAYWENINARGLKSLLVAFSRL